jgi:hypothetical protein
MVLFVGATDLKLLRIRDARTKKGVLFRRQTHASHLQRLHCSPTGRSDAKVKHSCAEVTWRCKAQKRRWPEVALLMHLSEQIDSLCDITTDA